MLTAEVAEKSDEQAAYVLRMQKMGRRVAELQRALASRDDLADFAPEPITTNDIRIWIDDVLERANQTFDHMAHRRSDLPEKDRRLADRLLSYRDSLSPRLRILLPENLGVSKIRHHGDFHLGQMLIVKDDVAIIDFEGEPRRSIEDRRRKAPAARDVAGLIRSIDYSATAALERALKSAPDEYGKLAYALDGWRERSIAAFLSAYRSSLGDTRLWPKSRKAADRLLDFFLLEKAFYEIEYERAHRPEWLRVPISGTLRILSRSEGTPR
jgi:maltose alpha-D-glucosyltransferase/alpha-amylase